MSSKAMGSRATGGVKVDLSLIEGAISAAFGQLRDKHGNEIFIKEEKYWTIFVDEALNMSQKPSEESIVTGDLCYELSQILGRDKDDAVLGYDLVVLSAALLLLSQKM